MSGRSGYRNVLTALLIAGSAAGGTLQDQEAQVADRSKKKKQSSGNTLTENRRDAAYSDFGSGTYPSDSGGGGFLNSFWAWLITAPLHYRGDDPSGEMAADEAWAQEERFVFPPHRAGQATVPYVRVDLNQQWVDGDLPVDTYDGRVELGYRFLALHGRMTRYEQSDGFTYDLQQFYAVIRYGGSRPFFVPGTFEFGIGAGVVQHTGDVSDDTSAAFTTPLKYWPTDGFGIEFRPAWYHWQEVAMSDYDLSAALGLRFVQLRGGYRWLWENGEGIVDVLSGPYAGVSISF